ARDESAGTLPGHARDMPSRTGQDSSQCLYHLGGVLAPGVHAQSLQDGRVALGVPVLTDQVVEGVRDLDDAPGAWGRLLIPVALTGGRLTLPSHGLCDRVQDPGLADDRRPEFGDAPLFL